MADKTVEAAEVQERLADLLDFVREGGEVVISEGEKPVARIVPVEEPVPEPRPPAGTGLSRQRYKKWKDEVAFFDGAVGDLVNDPRYKGRYVAVKERQIIDSDASDLELAKRMARLHRGEFVLIAKVDTRARCVEGPSPEIFR